LQLPITIGLLDEQLKQSEESEKPELASRLKLLESKNAQAQHHIDILGMDSCLMSMAEVYYQLVGSVDYLVGAEGFEPSGGCLTRGFLIRWVKDPNHKPEEIAKKIIDDLHSLLL
jgi:Clostripain family